MDLEQLLRSQAKRYRCAVCQSSMADCGINVLAQQGNRALVRVTCSSCSDENLLQIIFQTEGDMPGEAEEPREPLFDEGRPAVEGTISDDEMIDLHVTLRGFEGSFKELLAQES
jgi:hypothetical protein